MQLIIRIKYIILLIITTCTCTYSYNNKNIIINDYQAIRYNNIMNKKNKQIINKLSNKKCDCIFNFDCNDYPGEFFFHLHTPKTGGSTFVGCLLCWNKPMFYYPSEGYLCETVNTVSLNEQIQNGNKKIVTCEIHRPGHLNYFLGQLQLPNIKIMTFIRQPIDHIFSAVMHYYLLNIPGIKGCDTIHDVIEADENPLAPQCDRYYLRNMQTTALSPGNETSITEAINFVSKNVFYFGITSFYRASLCLLAYQFGQLSMHTKACDCRLHHAAKLRRSNDHKDKSNHSLISAAKILSNDDMMILESKYINLDRILYEVSLRLFLERILIAEKDVGMPLLCAHTDGDGIIAMKSAIRNPHWYGDFENTD